MRNRRLSLIGFLFFVQAAWAGGEQAPSFRRITAPQFVTGGDFVTQIVLSNGLANTCRLRVTYHQGPDQFPAPPLLTNGQQRGIIFTESVPPLGSRTLRVTDPEEGETFIGAASLDVLDPECTRAIDVQTRYLITDEQGRPRELFSYPIPLPVPLGACASTPVDFDPDASDGESEIPGFANVSLRPLTEVRRFMELLDRQGNTINVRQPELFDGQHSSMLLTEYFKFQGPFSGSWRVCYQGEQPDGEAPIQIDALFIGVVTSGEVVQFESKSHTLQSPGCVPSDRRICLKDKRFRVEVTWSASPVFNQPAGIVELQGDDGAILHLSDADDPELMIRLMDGCSINNHFWFFYATETTTEFTIRVTDTRADRETTYFNPMNMPPGAFTDVVAFATCP